MDDGLGLGWFRLGLESSPELVIMANLNFVLIRKSLMVSKIVKRLVNKSLTFSDRNYKTVENLSM